MSGMAGAVVDLLEYASSPAGKPLRVDRERGVIFDVKVLGEASANPPPNDNVYPRRTRESAASVLEGARVFVNHASKPGTSRGYQEAFGVLRGLHEAGDGVYAREFHFNPGHERASQLLWDAENAPEHVGFSIATQGRRSGSDRRVIEELLFDRRRHSVDLVTTPATTTGLFESLRGRHMTTTAKDLIESLKATRPGYVRGLKEAADSGIMPPDAAMDAPPDEAPASEAGDHEQALLDAAVAVLKDEGLSSADKLAKIRKILAIVDSGSGGGGGSADAGADMPMESLKLENAALRKLAAKGVRLTPLVEKAVRGCRTSKDIDELVEACEPERPGARSAAPAKPPEKKNGAVQEQRKGVPAARADRLAWLKE
jgi:hypothetical protein